MCSGVSTLIWVICIEIWGVLLAYIIGSLLLKNEPYRVRNRIALIHRRSLVDVQGWVGVD